MDYNIQEIAQRVMALRTLIGFTPEEMAEATNESVEEYLDKVKFIHIGSNMIPYADPEEFGQLVEEERKRQVKAFSVS